MPKLSPKLLLAFTLPMLLGVTAVRLYQAIANESAGSAPVPEAKVENADGPRTAPFETDQNGPALRKRDWSDSIMSVGLVNGKATNLVKPPYPAAAAAVKAAGAVNVQVTIDESGKVISAAAVSGHPLLRAAAVKAARASTFRPFIISDVPIKATGVVVYNFVP